MAKVDLHVHSRYSEKPNEWFLKRIGAAESYTEPTSIYERALAAGMDLVTVTDHNRMEGALELFSRYPDRVLPGVESTAYFPEDGCKVHLLIFGQTEQEFEEIQKLRTDIYRLRDFLVERKLAHSVAHATHVLNSRLSSDHVERLLLLFNVFETVNGSRNRRTNETLTRVLQNLNPDRIEDMRKRHSIEPTGDTPWIKGTTGGSDDHAGLFVGRSWTEWEGVVDRETFLRELREGRTRSGGDHNNFKYLAFTLYKIAYDFSRSRSSSTSRGLVSQLTDIFFRHGPRSFTDNLTLTGIRIFGSLGQRQDRVKQHFFELIDAMVSDGSLSLEDRMNLAYSRIGDITDEFMRMLFESFERDLEKGDVMSMIRNLSSSLPGVFLSVPFFTTLRHQNQGRKILDDLEERFGLQKRKSGKRILWFSDTLNDLNGVSVTLKKIGWAAHERGRDLRLVTALTEEEWDNSELPPETLNLPFVYKFQLPYYERYIMKIPAMLKALEAIHDFDPDEIYISTPGPIGSLGLLAAKLMNIRTVGVYHTDFTLQAREIVGDEALLSLVEGATRWFYSMMDENRVPTSQYMDLLEERGFDRSRMTLFRRGIDSKYFFPRENLEGVRQRFGMKEKDFHFLFVGRISRDKNLELLMDAYEKLVKEYPDLSLVLAGDGPFQEELEERSQHLPGVIFTGKLKQNDLPELYSACQLLVFPSFTDTFGMAVLEAQTCGLPALVSDRGGPQEIILRGETGEVAPWDSRELWTKKMQFFVDLSREKPEEYLEMRRASRALALRRNDWKVVIDEYLGNEVSETKDLADLPAQTGAGAA